jgi:TetR/AcrR family transcriptional regulator, regulator of autoinduction and epiphytic fitness
VSSPKRIRRDPEEAKLLLLRTAEQIMLEEGYAAVTVRRVARDAGVASPLIHYYYPTADDLLVALYRHTCARDVELLKRALDDPEPLQALWAYQIDKSRTALGAEFLALANHRKPIQKEIAQHGAFARKLQSEMLSRIVPAANGNFAECSAECLSMLLTSVSRNIIMEDAVGIGAGHDEAKAYIEHSLAQLTEKPKHG